MGQTITVEAVDNLSKVGDRFGDWDIKTNTIRVQSLKQGIPNDVVFATYYHELAHCVLDIIGHRELSADEDFVERLGQALYQSEKTRKYG